MDLQVLHVFMCVCMCVHARRVSEGKEGFQENPETRRNHLEDRNNAAWSPLPPPGLHTLSSGWVHCHHLLVSPLGWFPSHLSEVWLVFTLPARAGHFKSTCHFHPLCPAQCLTQGSDSEKGVKGMHSTPFKTCRLDFVRSGSSHQCSLFQNVTYLGQRHLCATVSFRNYLEITLIYQSIHSVT